MIINPISTGGNGLLPEIIVTAPSGSALDLLQGSVVLQTYTLSSTETQHTFTVKNTGTYTVRGTSGSDTASVDVVVDAIGQYSCTIEYFNGLRLYWLGDECEDVTGGWNSNGYSQSGWSVNSGTKNTDNMYLQASGSDSNYISLLGTTNIVPLTNYTKLHIECKTSGQADYPLQILICTSKTNIFSSAVLNVTMTNTDTQIITLDISNISSNYVLFMCTAYARRYGYVYKVWIE